MTKRLLALCRQAPYGNALAREGLEAILAAAAMEQVADILFCGDGVFQLLPEQLPADIEQKSLQRNLQALPVFGVEQAFICSKSLAQRGLDIDTLVQGELVLVPVDDSAALIASYDSVLSF
ncbi:sulfurtransferase complex subunit TusC [Microbulbifer marinus]|uniref:tRNA 2-thiouridine synthesizing protein C n=1 Tax=Microbulbifer marinus TaxID=658218 RepID=A0A1H3W7J1_9GAMM|nr:sulfurtransferase complex subunit TusC [Microbulbifer marinus]SDZ83099.1 tRNA 2-thiouridine synthesizing protein C [Microbulbifer marinus]